MEIIDEGILSREPSHGAYCPSIKQLGDGTLIASQDVGTSIGSCDHSIEILRSGDGGHTWQRQGTISGGVADDRWFYRIPDIEELPDGRLVMRATRFDVVDGDLFDAAAETLTRGEILLYWSNDAGHTWSNPQVVPVDLSLDKYTWNGAGGRLLCLSPSRWMYPLETFKPKGANDPLDQKAAAVFSSDGGETWDEFRVVADDPSNRLLWWDQMNARLPDGRIYTMLWAHVHGTSEDLHVHWVISEDEGRSWSEPQPTNIHGQVCSPIALPDGRVAAIYNHRHPPQGIRIAVSRDLSTFDLDREAVVFDAGAEATLGQSDQENYLAEHLQIGFGKPSGVLLNDRTLLAYFWCTSEGITHTRWVRLRY